MKAVITAEMSAAALAELKSLGFEPEVMGWGVTRTALDEQQLIDALSGASLLVCELEEVTARVFASCPDLKIVASARGNPVNVDLASAEAAGIWVINTPGRNADSVADFTVMLVLALQRGLIQASRHLRQKAWNVDDELPYFHFRGRELARSTIGLVGFGAVGRKVAQRLYDGFGARVVVHDPFVEQFPPNVEPLELDDLFAQSDVVSLHASAPHGKPLIGSMQLRLLGPEGYLINTARAAVVDEDDLIAALQSGSIAGAALDVFWDEPLSREHPLLNSDRVVLTPHIAGAAVDVSAHHSEIILADLAAIQRGELPAHAVVKGSPFKSPIQNG